MKDTLVQMTGRLLARLARYQAVQSGLSKLASAYKQEQTLSATSPGYEIAEVMPIDPRPVRVTGLTRINLLVPALSQRHVFGGIETALQVFDALRPHFDEARIIVTDEATPEPKQNAYYGGWPIAPMGSNEASGNHIVPAGSRWAQTLAIHEQDYFMATAWWTAHNALALLNWQQTLHPDAAANRRMLYLIQDYEPGFYSWSSRYLLAQATYDQPHRSIALINSHWLADHLREQGHAFSTQHVLQPRLHPALAAFHSRCQSFAKERVVLVYGRPSTERNAFSLIVASLRFWVSQYPLATQWRIVSAGESFTPVELGNGCTLESLGKLDIDAYANLLSRTAVGFSLMVSPHPSYPPLEMAAFGAHVVVNRFANKDLSIVSPLLVSAVPSSPQGFAAALLCLTERFDHGELGRISPQEPQAGWLGEFLQSSGPDTQWASTVAAELLSTARHELAPI